MININGEKVKIIGNPREILDDLVRLNLAIMQNENTMEINQDALQIVTEIMSRKDKDSLFKAKKLTKEEYESYFGDDNDSKNIHENNNG